MNLSEIINLSSYPLDNDASQNKCKEKLDKEGALALQNFMTPKAIEYVKKEGDENKHLAYYCANDHNVYLTDNNSDYPADHPRNISIRSSKG